MAREPYAEPPKVPAELKGVDFGEYRTILFKQDRALWRRERRFNVQFFHPGWLFDHPVRINVVARGRVTPVAYHREWFDYGKAKFEHPLPSDLGYAGFRLHYPLHSATYSDEFMTFLGASYFRVLGRQQQYGLSVRGLAIDTGMARPEEFPAFREFWIEEPARDANEVTVYALLDSPSCTGAYRFLIRPGTITQVEVTMSLFVRKDIEKLGIAPLTSMMFHGENATRFFDDYRPEVHDSDGLLVETQLGEWIWRPLDNRRTLQTTAFVGPSPRGFGLLQRDRDPLHYSDVLDEPNYERRPSVWVQPLGNWGPGHVELVEIPTDKEADDNIVAYWVADRPARKGDEIQLGYQIQSLLDLPNLSPNGRVEATRIGTAALDGTGKIPRETRYVVVDFNGGDLPNIPAALPVEAVVAASSGKVQQVITKKNGATGGWRTYIRFLPDPKKSADLRCFLRLDKQTLTETWTYLWAP